MIKWDPEKGWYDTNTGVGLHSAQEEARRKKYFEDRNKFIAETRYDPSKDYSGDFGKLFGAVDESSELYYAGPNPVWQHALSSRLGERTSQKDNIYGYTGYYEGSAGTVDRDLQRQMYRRNNAIEDMFRKGYSRGQIQAHVEGKRNVIEEGPDYTDYEKAKAGESMFGLKDPRKGWAEDYFDVSGYQAQTETQDGGADTGQTDTGQTDTGQTGGGPGDQTIAPQPPPAGGPGKGGILGSGKGGAQTPQQTQPPEQSNPFQPQQPQQPRQSQGRRMYGSSPIGLGTGYYGGMGSGGRQFGGGGSYFGGFGGQQSQPSYYGGYSQPYQQSYQQPSYGGYSSYGGYGGSMGGIGGFYQPMRYGGYR
jgi:hypothetical protein